MTIKELKNTIDLYQDHPDMEVTVRIATSVWDTPVQGVEINGKDGKVVFNILLSHVAENSGFNL